MNCARFERWISDSLDKALSEKKEKKLQAHLQACASCRVFEQVARRLQAESLALPGANPPEGYWPESLGRLRKALAVETLKPESKVVRGAGWKWSFVAAPLLLLATLGAFLLFRQPGGNLTADYSLVADQTLGFIYAELGDSPDLEAAFNQILESSIRKDLSGTGELVESNLENPLLYREVSEEEMTYILEEMKKAVKS